MISSFSDGGKKGGQPQMTKDTEYAYAAARVKAVERHMIEENGIHRMIDSKTAEDALKFLIDAGYGTSVADVSNVYDYEKYLEEEMARTYSLIEEISPESILVKVFLQRNDFTT